MGGAESVEEKVSSGHFGTYMKNKKVDYFFLKPTSTGTTSSSPFSLITSCSLIVDLVDRTKMHMIREGRVAVTAHRARSCWFAAAPQGQSCGARLQTCRSAGLKESYFHLQPLTSLS